MYNGRQLTQTIPLMQAISHLQLHTLRPDSSGYDTGSPAGCLTCAQVQPSSHSMIPLSAASCPDDNKPTLPGKPSGHSDIAPWVDSYLPFNSFRQSGSDDNTPHSSSAGYQYDRVISPKTTHSDHSAVSLYCRSCRAMWS